MKENGIVREIKDGIITVEIIPSDECKGCGSCGASQPRSLKMSADGASEAIKEGDAVSVDVDSPAMLKIYILLYGLPLMVFVGMILGVYALTGHPLLSFAGAVLATAVTWALTGRYMRSREEFMPRICRKR